MCDSVILIGFHFIPKRTSEKYDLLFRIVALLSNTLLHIVIINKISLILVKNNYSPTKIKSRTEVIHTNSCSRLNQSYFVIKSKNQ